MRILFVNVTKNLGQDNGCLSSHPYHILPPIDIGYCAAVLEEANHAVSFIDSALGQWKISDICTQVRTGGIDTVVLKPNILTYRLTLELAREIKKFTRCIICIGPVSSVSPELFIFSESPIDACIINEPELALLEICDRVCAGRRIDDVTGVAYFDARLRITKPRELNYALDDLPFPKHDLFSERGYSFLYPIRINKKIKFASMLTNRGCPYPCTFCSPIRRVSYGREYRVRSAGNVVDEMESLTRRGVNMIYFLDDLFTYDYRHTERLCDEIISRNVGVAWAAQVRADSIDRRLLTKMKKAGCGCVNFGIEVADDTMLKAMDKRITIDHIEQAAAVCRKAGINTVGSFIIGLPGQTTADVSADLRLAQRLQLDLVEVLLSTPYPGSRMFETYGRQADIDAYSHYDFAVALQTTLTAGELRREQQRFYRSYYVSARYVGTLLFYNWRWVVSNLIFDTRFLKNVLFFLFQKHPDGRRNESRDKPQRNFR